MSPNVEQLFAQAVRLPQIPHVMQEVIHSLRDENVSVDALAELVGNDQVIAAKVLRLANSSFYGARRKVAGIGDAVTLIGLNAFRNLVIASAMVSAFPPVPGFDLPAFWRTSMLVANLSQIIGRTVQADRDVTFTAGLMHEIGHLLVCFDSASAGAAMTTARNAVRLAGQRAAEQALLGLDHFEVGAELARRWNFPESIQRAIASHDASDADSREARVVHAAVLIAGGIQSRTTFDDMQLQLPAALAEELKLDKAWFEEHGEVFDLLLDEADALV